MPPLLLLLLLPLRLQPLPFLCPLHHLSPPVAYPHKPTNPSQPARLRAAAVAGKGGMRRSVVRGRGGRL